MNPLIDQVLEYCAARGIENISVVAPFAIDAADIRKLRCEPRIKFLSAIETGDGAAPGADGWFVPYRPDRQCLPARRGNIATVFLGGPAMISLACLPAMIARRQWSVICPVEGRFRRCSVRQLLFWRAANCAADWLRHRPSSHPLVRSASRLRRISALRRVWRRVLARDAAAAPDDDAEGIFTALLRSVATDATGAVDCGKINRGRIVHVNAGLALGGAERQICVTLAGIADRVGGDLILLGEYRASIEDFPPFVETLQRAGVSYRGVPRLPVGDALRSLPPETAVALSQLPAHLLADTVALISVLRRLRPETVHAWQDATNIRACIAALIAGVPRIVLAARNVSPAALPTHQGYMRPAYRALLRHPGVSIVINSAAGARSYAAWLSLDINRFIVIRNAFEPDTMAGDSTNLRRRLGISGTAAVIGGVFRLVPQKRPLLWVEAAAKLAQQAPEAAFVVVGDGPMRRAVLARANALGLRGRFFLLDSRRDIGSVYRMLDVFFLASEYEGLANVLLEAQYAGLPVVCSDAGGNREAVKRGETAIVVDDADADTLSDALLRILREPKWRARAEHGGPEHVRDRFSRKRMVERICRLYGIAGTTRQDSS